MTGVHSCQWCRPEVNLLCSYKWVIALEETINTIHGVCILHSMVCIYHGIVTVQILDASLHQYPKALWKVLRSNLYPRHILSTKHHLGQLPIHKRFQVISWPAWLFLDGGEWYVRKMTRSRCNVWMDDFMRSREVFEWIMLFSRSMKKVNDCLIRMSALFHTILT